MGSVSARSRGLAIVLALSLGSNFGSDLVKAQEVPLDPAAVRQYNLAVGLQNKKLYAQAAVRWAAFIKDYAKDPRVPNAYHSLGICQLQDNKLTEAAASFRFVIANYPKFTALDASQFNLALVLYNVASTSKKPEDYRAASAAFAEVAAKYAQSKHAPSALYYQGECAYAVGELPSAVAAYEKVIATYPQSPLLPEVYYALGTAQQEAGQDAAALATYQAFLQKYPTDPQVNECKLRIGLAQFKLEKYAEAESVFAQLVAVPDFALADLALLRQAQCLHLREQYPQAAALYLTLPQKFAQSQRKGEALLSAAKCFYNAGDFPRVSTTVAPVIAEKLPEAAEATYWVARSLIRLMKPAEAVAELDKAIAAHAQSPYLPQLVFARADALYELPERRKETIPLYREFAAKYPDHELAPKALYMASLAALKLADFPTAQQSAAAFLANPKFAKHELLPSVLFVGGESFLLAPMAEPAKAEPLFRRVVAEFPMHAYAPQSQVRIGLCLHLSKQYDPAIAFLTPVVGTLKDPALAAEAQLLIGRCHGDAGRPEPAIAAYRASLAAKPNWDRGDEALLALAVTLRSQKKNAEAAAELQKLNAAYPMSLYRDQAFYQLGEVAFEEKKLDEAAANYKQVVTNFPKSDLAAPAQFGLGWAYYAKDDFAQAVPAFTALLTTFPQSDVALKGKYMRGLAERRLMQFEPAIKDLTEFIAAKPTETDGLEARYALALCQQGLKQYAPAVATLVAILKDKPDYADGDKVLYELGYAYTELKQQKEASEAFRQLATKYPKSPKSAESLFRVGEFHEAAKQYAEAAVAFAAGMDLTKDPGLRERLQYKLGWVQHQAGKFAEAAAAFQAQIKEHPQGTLLHAAEFLAGECLFRQDKFAEALPLYALVVAAKAKDQDKALYRSGTCANNTKNWAVGQQHFSALVQQFPKYELINEARYGLGLSLQMQNKLDEAKAVYDQVTKETNSETAAKSRFMIGVCAFTQKKFDEAIEHFLTTSTGYPYEHWQAEASFELGRCFIELKMPAQAKETLEGLVTQFPKHARAKDASALLASLK